MAGRVILSGLVVLVVLWVVVGIVGYRRTIQEVEVFLRRIHYYNRMEEQAGTISTQAYYYNQAQELIHAHDALHVLGMEYQEDPRHFKRSLLKNMLVLGPLYYL